MSERRRKNANNLKLRANAPVALRVVAVVGIAATILGIGIAFYRSYGYKEFRMKSFPTELSKDVVAEVRGYERTERDGERVKYFIKADKATTFADNHQELENVFLQVFDETGESFDKISAEKAVYIPAPDGTKNFNAFFAGSVDLETRDHLRVKTEQLAYNKESEIVEAEETIEFARDNLSGKSFGAIVRVREKSFDLLRDVEINSYENAAAENKIEAAKIRAGSASFDLPKGKIDLRDAVKINLTPSNGQATDVRAERASAFFTDGGVKKIELNGGVNIFQKPNGAQAKWSEITANRAVIDVENDLKRVEIFENVTIKTSANDAEEAARIKTDYAVYDEAADKFELKNAVEIVVNKNSETTTIRSRDAVYEQSNGKIFLTGGAEVVKAKEFIKSDDLTVELFAGGDLKNASARGNAFLKRTEPEQVIEISGGEINAAFGENQLLQTVTVAGASRAVLIPNEANDYSKISLAAPRSIRLNFSDGLLRDLQTEGRTNVDLIALDNDASAANKKIVADAVKTVFNANGKDLARTEAVGNAELTIEPLRAAPENFRTSITAPRLDCDFFERGNNARFCTAAVKTKAVRVPTVAGKNSGTQTILADRLNASFNPQTKDVERFEAAGNARFSELERNAQADNITFSEADEIVRLRGGKPTVWDDEVRAKAVEIDWDTRAEKTFLRGKVSTSNYSRRQTGGATPFKNSKSPVFVTADAGEINHQTETALYSGNARAWQDNNFVSADKLVLRQKEGEFVGEGAVKSSLYEAKQKQNGREANAPVFVSAQKLFYDKNKKLIRYENDVDVRQGTDRIVAGVVNVFLDDKNEVAETIAEKNVVITQPQRKAVGDFAQYTAASETMILRGNPARVEDGENGSSQAAQMTIFLRENRAVAESKTNQNNTGRIRSVYKIKKQ